MTTEYRAPLRGQLFFADLEGVGEKPVVVVSNNGRNNALPNVLVARITTVPKPFLPSIVLLPDGEPLAGRVLCDELRTVAKTQLRRPAGELSRRAMGAVDAGLRVALAL